MILRRIGEHPLLMLAPLVAALLLTGALVARIVVRVRVDSRGFPVWLNGELHPALQKSTT